MGARAKRLSDGEPFKDIAGHGCKTAFYCLACSWMRAPIVKAFQLMMS
jgi:hypothetical protein